jgi:hypothetical protein
MLAIETAFEEVQMVDLAEKKLQSSYYKYV